MNQLIVVSTYKEIAPYLKNSGIRESDFVDGFLQMRANLSVLITGVGSPRTVYSLTKTLSKSRFDRVVNVGVAGSFRKHYQPGILLEITEDRFADIGIDDNGSFISVFDSGLCDKERFPFRDGKLVNPSPVLDGINKAKGITVNTVSGSEKIIRDWVNKYDPDLESMEGAAVLMVCLIEDLPLVQVRSVSNYVTPRNRSNWKMEEAIDILNKWLISFVSI